MAAGADEGLRKSMALADRSMQKTVSQDFDRHLMRKLQQYQIDLQVAKRQISETEGDRDRTVRDAQERAEALNVVLDALVGSLRPYGLDRKKFAARVRAAAQETPTEGPQAVRHTVLLAASSKVLAPRTA